MSSGGGAGEVSYPDYLQDFHQCMLNGDGVTSNINAMDIAMNQAWRSNPFSAALAYNPVGDLAPSEFFVNTMRAVDYYTMVENVFSNFSYALNFVNAIMPVAEYNTLLAQNVTDYGNMLTAEISTSILPKFHRGMQDINAVQTSSFVVGDALIWAERNRNVAKYASDLDLRHYSERINFITRYLELTNQAVRTRMDWYAMVAQYSIEFARIKLVAMKEQTDADLIINEKDVTWDLKMFQYAGNFMAAISGAAATTNSTGSGVTSTLGGALSGASVGSQTIGGGYGAALGAIVGGVAGYFSNN